MFYVVFLAHFLSCSELSQPPHERHRHKPFIAPFFPLITRRVGEGLQQKCPQVGSLLLRCLPDPPAGDWQGPPSGTPPRVLSITLQAVLGREGHLRQCANSFLSRPVARPLVAIFCAENRQGRLTCSLRSASATEPRSADRCVLYIHTNRPINACRVRASQSNGRGWPVNTVCTNLDLRLQNLSLTLCRLRCLGCEWCLLCPFLVVWGVFVGVSSVFMAFVFSCRCLLIFTLRVRKSFSLSRHVFGVSIYYLLNLFFFVMKKGGKKGKNYKLVYMFLLILF